MHAERVRRLKLGALIGIVVYNLFLVTDAMVVPDVLRLAVAVRVGIVTPVLIGLVAMLSWKRAARNVEWIIAIGAVVVPVSISAILLASRSTEATHYHSGGLGLAFIYYIVVMRMRFAQSLVACLAAVATGFGMVLVSDMSTPLGTSYGVVFLCTQLFMLMGSYQLDIEHLRTYLNCLNERLARLALDQANARLAQLSSMDPLTGMPNRRQFDAHSVRLWEQARVDGGGVGIVFIDVDHFKAYNDCYGHAQGDRCLQAVGAALTRAANPVAGALVARYGGEEFVAVLPTLEPGCARAVADRMRAAVLELAIPHAASMHDGIVTVSIGVAVGRPVAGDRLEQTLDAADQAAYAVKRAGRNRVRQVTAAQKHDETIG